MPPTRKPFSVHAVLYCELDPPRERLWRIRAFFDLYDASVQLGVLPAHGGVGERALMLLRGFGLRAVTRPTRSASTTHAAARCRARPAAMPPVWAALGEPRRRTSAQVDRRLRATDGSASGSRAERGHARAASAERCAGCVTAAERGAAVRRQRVVARWSSSRRASWRDSAPIASGSCGQAVAAGCAAQRDNRGTSGSSRSSRAAWQGPCAVLQSAPSSDQRRQLGPDPVGQRGDRVVVEAEVAQRSSATARTPSGTAVSALSPR